LLAFLYTELEENVKMSYTLTAGSMEVYFATRYAVFAVRTMLSYRDFIGLPN